MAQRNLTEEASTAEERAAELSASAQPAPADLTLADELAEMAKSKAKKAGARTYVMQAGDSLSSIAAAVYGDAGRWTEIFEANRDVLSDPNLVRVGQELRIP